MFVVLSSRVPERAQQADRAQNKGRGRSVRQDRVLVLSKQLKSSAETIAAEVRDAGPAVEGRKHAEFMGCSLIIKRAYICKN